MPDTSKRDPFEELTELNPVPARAYEDLGRSPQGVAIWQGLNFEQGSRRHRRDGIRRTARFFASLVVLVVLGYRCCSSLRLIVNPS